MPKHLLFGSMVIVLLLVTTGCQPLGDQLGQRYPGNQNSETAVDDTSDTSQPTTTKEIENYNNIFFGSTKYDPTGSNCETVYWVHIPATSSEENPITKNIELLLAGPTSRWKDQGYFSAIPGGTKLLAMKEQNNVVTLNFSKELNAGGGSCEMQLRRSQIIATAKAAAEAHLGKTIDRVIIEVEGDAATALQP